MFDFRSGEKSIGAAVKIRVKQERISHHEESFCHVKANGIFPDDKKGFPPPGFRRFLEIRRKFIVLEGAILR